MVAYFKYRKADTLSVDKYSSYLVTYLNEFTRALILYYT